MSEHAQQKALGTDSCRRISVVFNVTNSTCAFSEKRGVAVSAVKNVPYVLKTLRT